MSRSFFASKHENLRNDYSDGSGVYVDSCTLVAIDIATILSSEGADPRIKVLRGEVVDSIGNRAALVPLPYDGRVTWGAHVICQAAGIVYDPMLPRPLPTEDYFIAAFDQPVDIEDHTHILNQ